MVSPAKGATTARGRYDRLIVITGSLHHRKAEKAAQPPPCQEEWPPNFNFARALHEQ